MLRHVPLFTSHKRTDRSPLLARVFPSGLKHTDHTVPVWPCQVLSNLPLPTSHKRTVWSSPPLARVSPLGLKATAWTQLVCPRKVRSGRPFFCHIRISPVVVPAASKSPCGLNATQRILPKVSVNTDVLRSAWAKLTSGSATS